MSAKHSLVLITVYCFRADHAGFLGYQRPATPFLASIEGQSVVFSSGMVAGAPTYFSLPAIMSSRYPLSLVRDLIGLAPKEPTIASAAGEAGYVTAAFLAANRYLSQRFGYNAGFQVFYDFLDHDSLNEGAMSASVDAADGKNGSSRNRWNQRLAKIVHKLGPAGSIYDELYFRYCQRLARSQQASLDQLRRLPAADVLVDRACD